MKKRIIIDMDGVIANIYPKLIANEPFYQDRFVKPEDLSGIPEPEAFPQIYKTVTTDGFFRDLPVMDGAVEALLYLQEKYEIMIVSAATEFPNSLNDKLAWLNQYFPFLDWRQIIFCGRKDTIEADIMIDDHPKNLSTFKGTRYIFSQPHNTNIADDSYQRIDHWSEIFHIL